MCFGRDLSALEWTSTETVMAQLSVAAPARSVYVLQIVHCHLSACFLSVRERFWPVMHAAPLIGCWMPLLPSAEVEMKSRVCVLWGVLATVDRQLWAGT